MKYAVVTPEDQPDTYLVYYMMPSRNTLVRHVHRAVVETDSGVSIPLVIGVLMAMSWYIAYGLAHH
jgi:hypothetical protein